MVFSINIYFPWIIFTNSKIATIYAEDSRKTPTFKETIYNNNIDRIIGKNKGDKDSMINELATLPLLDLENDSKYVFYCKLAIERQE